MPAVLPDRVDLFSLVYAGELDALRLALLQRPTELHLLDRHGDSLLHLAIRRVDTAAVRCVLAAGFDVNTRSAGNWTPMEEAMACVQACVGADAAADVKAKAVAAQQVLREIHLAVQLDEQKRWAGRRETVLRTLRSMPDFSAVLAWRIGSYMLGVATLLRRFLPSDTCLTSRAAPSKGACCLRSTCAAHRRYRIRKRGVRVRVDSTLAGLDYDALTWHRGLLSLIIRFDAGYGEPEILMVDQQRRRTAEYLRTWAFLKPDLQLTRQQTSRLFETGLQRETSDQAECALTRHPADLRVEGELSPAAAARGRGGGGGGGGGRDGGGGGGVGGSGVRFVSELVPLMAECDLWGHPSTDAGAPSAAASSARYQCRCMLNVRLREREGVIATPPDRRAHTEALLASEAAAADSEQHDKPSSAGDLALLQRFAQGGKVLGLFLRPASARVTCSWGLPLSLDQFCVVMRLLAPINRHISGVCDYLLGMCPPCAFPTRLSVPLPVGFYVEAHLPSFSDDCAHPHAAQFAFGAKGGGLAAGGGELFDAPPEFEVVGEDEFLDDLLDAFLSSLGDEDDEPHRPPSLEASQAAGELGNGRGHDLQQRRAAPREGHPLGD